MNPILAVLTQQDFNDRILAKVMPILLYTLPWLVTATTASIVVWYVKAWGKLDEEAMEDELLVVYDGDTTYSLKDGDEEPTADEGSDYHYARFGG